MIITHNYANFPDEVDYRYGEIMELENYDLITLENLGIDEIWYWYAQGGYEGSGQILMRKGDLYDVHDAGHCSCYGPTERADFIGKPFKELFDSISKEYMKDLKPLFKLAQPIEDYIDNNYKIN